MATPKTETAAAAAARGKKDERINVLKFRVAGYIEVNTTKPATITGAIDAFNKAIENLKAAGATITADENPQFTTVNPNKTDDEE